MDNTNNSRNGATAAAGDGPGLKKGPWTAAEDAVLMEYVRKHGEGNWNSVQKNSGLMRCGKSCRLRWANHLRPNLKKGSFTTEEERLIIHLHSQIGNKWARMASQLPGRTDNEIKNFWNTRLKRLQRAGLPLYPKEFEETNRINFQQHQENHQQQLHKHHNFLHSPNYNKPFLSLLDPSDFSASPMDNSSFYGGQFKFHGDSIYNNGGLAMPLSQIPQYARPNPCSLNLFDQNLTAASYNEVEEFENNASFTSLIMGAQVEPISFVPGLNSELPSIQMPPQPTTPVSHSGVSDIMDDRSSSKNIDGDNGNSGLLDVLLQESQNLSRNEKSNLKYSVAAADAYKGKSVVEEFTNGEEKEEEEEDDDKLVELSLRNGGGDCDERRCGDLSYFQSSIGYAGKNPSEEPVEEMDSMVDDDDLLSLLNFSSSAPLPEWYKKSTRNISLTGPTGEEGGPNNSRPQDTLSSSPAATTTIASPSLECSLGSCNNWNNMPSICEEHPHQNMHTLQKD